jgi:hypothetical protein
MDSDTVMRNEILVAEFLERFEVARQYAPGETMHLTFAMANAMYHTLRVDGH